MEKASAPLGHQVQIPKRDFACRYNRNGVSLASGEMRKAKLLSISVDEEGIAKVQQQLQQLTVRADELAGNMAEVRDHAVVRFLGSCAAAA